MSRRFGVPEVVADAAEARMIVDVHHQRGNGSDAVGVLLYCCVEDANVPVLHEKLVKGIDAWIRQSAALVTLRSASRS